MSSSRSCKILLYFSCRNIVVDVLEWYTATNQFFFHVLELVNDSRPPYLQQETLWYVYRVQAEAHTYLTRLSLLHVHLSHERPLVRSRHIGGDADERESASRDARVGDIFANTVGQERVLWCAHSVSLLSHTKHVSAGHRFYFMRTKTAFVIAMVTDVISYGREREATKIYTVKVRRRWNAVGGRRQGVSVGEEGHQVLAGIVLGEVHVGGPCEVEGACQVSLAFVGCELRAEESPEVASFLLVAASLQQIRSVSMQQNPGQKWGVLIQVPLYNRVSLQRVCVPGCMGGGSIPGGGIIPGGGRIPAPALGRNGSAEKYTAETQHSACDKTRDLKTKKKIKRRDWNY